MIRHFRARPRWRALMPYLAWMLQDVATGWLRVRPRYRRWRLPNPQGLKRGSLRHRAVGRAGVRRGWRVGAEGGGGGGGGGGGAGGGGGGWLGHLFGRLGFAGLFENTIQRSERREEDFVLRFQWDRRRGSGRDVHPGQTKSVRPEGTDEGKAPDDRFASHGAACICVTSLTRLEPDARSVSRMLITFTASTSRSATMRMGWSGSEATVAAIA